MEFIDLLYVCGVVAPCHFEADVVIQIVRLNVAHVVPSYCLLSLDHPLTTGISPPYGLLEFGGEGQSIGVHAPESQD